jgi:hypothetical protein
VVLTNGMPVGVPEAIAADASTSRKPAPPTPTGWLATRGCSRTTAYQTDGENVSARAGVTFAAGWVLSVTVEDLDLLTRP